MFNKTNFDPFEKSGATFERKVVEKFEQAGWLVETKQHYIDPFENKPREIDIIATKSTVIGDNPHQRLWGFSPVPYEMKIFLECKYLVDPKGLFARKANYEKNLNATLGINVYQELYSEYYRTYQNIPDLLKQHRYLSSENIIYDSTDNSEKGFGVPAIKQIVHGLMSQTHRSREKYSIEYSVIIANSSDNLLIRFDGSDKNNSYTEPHLFEFDYVDARGRKQYFLVDVLSFEHLDKFIEERNFEFDNFRKAIFDHESFRQHSESRMERETGTDLNPYL